MPGPVLKFAVGGLAIKAETGSDLVQTVCLLVSQNFGVIGQFPIKLVNQYTGNIVE